jgi:hypothetical protein
MSTWRSFEKDFREIPDPYNDLRADWSHQEAIPNHWRLAGGSLREARDRFEQIAKLAGKALILDRAIISILPEEVTNEGDHFKRWLTALRLMTKRFEYGPVGTLLDANGQPVGHVVTGTVHNVIKCSALLCLQLALEEVPSFQPSADLRLHIDDIDSFSKVSDIKPFEIADCLDSNGRVDLAENVIKKALADILAVTPVKNDWGGEDDDLYTSNLIIHGQRTPTAVALKGRGTKSQFLRIKDCGKNGDQLVRLFQAPAELFVLQYVGEIDENVIKDIEGKAQVLRAHGQQASYCIINGQDTARLLRAYGKL